MIEHTNVSPGVLSSQLQQFFSLSGPKIRRLQNDWDPQRGAPVFTINGKYTTRGWTEWTQGFMYGCQILQYDATGDEAFLELGRKNTHEFMAPHISHIGVHDHGFNNVSTYGNLRRLALENRSDDSLDAVACYELALKLSGAIQATRWTNTNDGTGFIYSFNGPHSLFSDTIRSCRALVLAHLLNHTLMGENDRRISLLDRAMQHIRNTARYNVYFGTGRDHYDVRGRVAHESLFNTNDGNYRCASTQQGYSPFTTWTRGLSWILLGAAEQLEFFTVMPSEAYATHDDTGDFLGLLADMARATADFYIENTPTDGIPYWDTDAPGLIHLGDYQNRPAQPDNLYEPVDSSAAAICAQGLLRLGRYLGKDTQGKPYYDAGLKIASTLFSPPYISEDPEHHGMLLHAVYHRPNGWDHVPEGKQIPQGESCMWGDYHAMELAVYLQRELEGGAYLTFYGPI